MPITINGDGTLTGVAVGGLPDGIVDADMIAANAVSANKIQDNIITNAKLLKQSIAFYGRQTTGVSLSPSNYHTLTDLTTGTINQNTGSSFNTTTGVFTVASGQEGIYFCFCGVGWSNLHRVDHVLTGISVNGADPVASSRNVSQYTSNSSTDVTAMSQNISIVSLAVGDTVSGKGYHSYQDNTSRTSANIHTFFGGVRIVGL
tara:strand:+ start:382 stop:990 length:609 start_codon:yes stop_codon:yes gene_type:complete